MSHECESEDPYSDQEFWHIAEADALLLIDTAGKLNNASREILSNASIVGIDCEWPPREQRPAATVLQLACWSSAKGLTVLVLVRTNSIFVKLFKSSLKFVAKLVLFLPFFNRTCSPSTPPPRRKFYKTYSVRKKP